MWGEISSSNERYFPQVNHLWWKSWRSRSLLAIWTFWSVLNMKELGTCLILLDERPILIGRCKKLCQFISKKTTLLLFQVSIYKGEKKNHNYSFILLYWSWKPALSPQKVAEFPVSVQLGMRAMMHISPLSLWNKPNIVFKSNSSADKTFFFPILPFQLSSDTRSWLLLLDDNTDTFLEAPALLLSFHCCLLSFVKAAAENCLCRKDTLPEIYS